MPRSAHRRSRNHRTGNYRRIPAVSFVVALQCDTDDTGSAMTVTFDGLVQVNKAFVLEGLPIIGGSSLHYDVLPEAVRQNFITGVCQEGADANVERIAIRPYMPEVRGLHGEWMSPGFPIMIHNP